MGFAGVWGPHDQGIKINVVWVHVFVHVFVHNVHLSIADSENMAFYISRSRCLSFVLKKHTRRTPLTCIVVSTME